MGDFAEAHKKALQKSKKENWVRFAHDVYESAQTWEEKLYYVELAKDISAKVIKKQTDDLRNLISYILR